MLIVARDLSHIVTELNAGDRRKLPDFIGYAYDVCRHQPDQYARLVRDAYRFADAYYNRALAWLEEILSRHVFSRDFVMHAIEHGLIDRALHWQWRYVQGLACAMPVDCTVILQEADDQLLVWADYGADQAEQPLAPFAELAYAGLDFTPTHRDERFLIYTLSGQDRLRERMVDIELRVYKRGRQDVESERHFCDHAALAMADDFLRLFHAIKARHPSGMFSEEEVDALLMPAPDEPKR